MSGAADADFDAWVASLPATHWSKYDLSACRLGWDAALATQAARPGVGVTVKPLEWRSLSLPVGSWAARTPFGDYRVGENGRNEFYFFLEGHSHSPGFKTIVDAKAAAQTDYESRITAALHPDTAAPAEAVGIVENHGGIRWFNPPIPLGTKLYASPPVAERRARDTLDRVVAILKEFGLPPEGEADQFEWLRGRLAAPAAPPVAGEREQ
jgi:hypothetical protein